MRSNKAGLADLKRLRKAVAQTRQQAQRQAAAQAARPGDTSPAEDLAAFKQAMQRVTPLPSRGTVVHRKPETAPSGAPGLALRRAAALGEAKARADEGVSDGSVTHLLSEGGTAYVRHDAAPDTARKLRRGDWRAGAELDLHGLRVEQARHATLSFLDECLAHGIRCLRIVHGKGYGSQGMAPVLKDKVRSWLVQKPDVIAFSEAPEREGGAGALLVLMRLPEGERA